MHEGPLIISPNRAAPHKTASTNKWALRFAATSTLHGAAGREAGNGVGGRAVGEGRAEVAVAVGVVAREVEEVDAGEDDEEAAEKGDCVYGRGGVEALEEEEGGD
jgi:hypothetical protein